jgi:hypothetical protein
MIRRLSLISAFVAAPLLVAAPAALAGVNLYVFEPTSGPPGTVVAVSGTDCFEEVRFYDSTTGIPVQIGSTTPNPDGTFQGSFTIGLDVSPGSILQVGAQCGSDATQYIEFEVTQPAIEPSLPTTTTLIDPPAHVQPVQPRLTG